MDDYTEDSLQIMNGNATCNTKIITLSFDKSWFGFAKYINGAYYQHPTISELYQKSIPKGRLWDHDDIYLYLHEGAYYVIKMSKSYPHVIAQQTEGSNWLIAIKNRLRIIGRKVPRYARKTAKNIKKAGIAVGKGIYSFSGHIVNEIAEGVSDSGITSDDKQNPAETKSNIGAAHTVEDQTGGGIVTRYTEKGGVKYGSIALNARQDAIESFMKLIKLHKIQTSYDEQNGAIYIKDEFEEYTATSDNCSFKFEKTQDGGKLNRRTMRRHKKTHRKQRSHNRKTK